MTSPAYRIDGAPAQRGDFYATACDPRQSVVVEACAGAGKTWMLVSRILRALLDGVEPQQILAITFTRKAAGEMRERLAGWLAEFSDARSDHPKRVQALVDRGLVAAEAERLAPALGQLHEHVLASGRTVQVRTFHAWFAQLLRMAPLEVLGELGLSPGMGLIEDPAELGPELMRRFQRRVAADEGLRVHYHALVARQGRSTVQRWLETAWSRRSEIERADAAGVLEGSIPSASIHFPVCAGLAHPLDAWGGAPLQYLMSDLAAALERAGTAGKKKHLESAMALRLALSASDPRQAFAHAWLAVHTKEGELRKLKDVPSEFAALSDCLSEIDEQLKQHDAHEDQQRLIPLVRVLLAEYAALKRERGLVDMGDLEHVALQLLGEGDWAAWIQERLDARLRHLLIDEFQDTSPLQWHALRPWLEGYAGAGGGFSGREPLSVFIVGDPKQSIYRFRRAEPRVFAAAGEFVAEALAGRRLSCDHTRRNAPAVLAALNEVFAAAQVAGQYAGFRPHTTAAEAAPGDPLPGVFSLPREAKPPSRGRADRDAPLVWRDSLTEPRLEEEERRTAAEARQVAAAIAELLAAGQVRPGEIQVLARRREVLGHLADALRVLHIPHVRPEDLRLADEPEARDLVALIDALASPGHDLSLAQALKSPVFGADDDELLWLAARSRGPASGGWWAALQSAGADAPASLVRAAALLSRWADAAHVLPPHDLLDRILHEGDIAARMLRAAPPERRDHARAVIDSLIAQTLALDGGRYTTPYRFVRALKSGWLTGSVAAVEDAVQLLTVHGAKGLEAEVVFLMDTDPEARNPETGSLLVDWPVEASHPTRVAFVGRWARLAPSLRPLSEAEDAESAREEMNGLYVAMTRARRRLVVSSIDPRRKASDPAWWDRLLAHAQPWNPAAAVPPAAAAAEAIEVVAWPAPVFSEPAVPRAVPAQLLAGADTRATLMGEAFHRLMQWSTAPAGPRHGELASWLEMALPAAAAEFGLSADEAAFARRAAEAVWASRACAPFLRGPGIVWAGDEVPVAEGGDALRIDRLVAVRNDLLEPRTWWVLDYKLEPHPQDDEDNRIQLARYRQAVASLQPGEPVRAAFINARGELIEPA
ncbi:UvrD-helicase domain-containing protein [Ideonella sp. YS5]|uniref:UvrD-helicase domain-containing protein n=1 Tax=Ideonella sp. YS5 TaxID=3453714 RepID=UPI003EEB8FE0